MLSAKDVETVRAIARAGSDYNSIKHLLGETQFDIQDGMDVTLWIQPVGTPVEKTLTQK